MAGKSPFRFPISPLHQCSSDLSVTVITSPRRKSSSPDSCAWKSYKACTNICCLFVVVVVIIIKQKMKDKDSNLDYNANYFIYKELFKVIHQLKDHQF